MSTNANDTTDIAITSAATCPAPTSAAVIRGSSSAETGTPASVSANSFLIEADKTAKNGLKLSSKGYTLQRARQKTNLLYLWRVISGERNFFGVGMGGPEALNPAFAPEGCKNPLRLVDHWSQRFKQYCTPANQP